MKLATRCILSAFLLCSLLGNSAPVGSFQEIAGSPFAAGAAPASLAYSPIVSGNLFSAVPNFSDNTVSVYQVDQNSGAFSQVAGSPFGTGAEPAWLAFSPVVAGNLFSAIVNFNDNTVSVYNVNQTSGAFTPVANSPFATGSAPYTVAFSPVVSGNLFAAVPNSDGQNVSVYQVDQSTGAFTPVPGSPFATGNGPYTVVFTPLVSGNLFAAITNYVDNTVSVYSVNQTTGAFTEIAGSPFATGAGPYGIAYSPVVGGNLFAAIVNNTDNTASVYQVNQTTGAFTPVAGSPFVTGAAPNEIAFSPVASGNLFAAAVNFNSNNVSVYVVDQTTGAFTEVSGSPFASGTQPDGIAFSPLLTGGLFAATGNFGSNNASVYQVTLASAVPPGISKSFSPNPVVTGGLSTLTINLTNGDPTSATTLSAPFTDNLPVGLTVAGAANTTCVSGIVSTTSTSVTLSMGTILPANSSCIITVLVTSSEVGNYLNTISEGALQTTPNGNNPSPATATLTVGGPSLRKSFSPREVCVCGKSLLTITLSNPFPTAAQLTAPLVDRLPLHLATHGIASNTCGGSLIVRGSSITLSNGSIPALGSCALSVKVGTNYAGRYTNTLPVGALQTTQGSNLLPASATLEVCEHLD